MTNHRAFVRRSSWKQLLVAGLIPATLILGACGDDGDDAVDATSPSGAGAQVTTTTGMMEATPSTGMGEASPSMDHSMMTPTTGTGMTDASPTMGDGMAMVTSDTGAAALRTGLTLLLQEHVYLAGSATGAAIGGRTEEFEAAAATLDENSIALSEAIGSVYGDDAEMAFLELWRTHIGFFVDYTNGVATGDQAAADEALANLDGYRTDFGAFIASANPNLPAEAVAEELGPHVETLTAAIDAQVAEDPAAFDLLKEAANHMPMTAAVLAGGIVTQFPDQFDGTADAPAAELRAGLNALLQEHAYLAGFATDAALNERPDQFEAAAATLDTNSVELSEAIGSVYGPEAAEAFLPLWRAHIGFFVDYTTGVATDDTAAQDEAVENLMGYTQDFAAFLNSANGLPTETVAALLEEHVLALKDAVDAQETGDPVAAWTALREAAGHMQMIADPLTEATVQTFPDAFAQ